MLDEKGRSHPYQIEESEVVCQGTRQIILSMGYFTSGTSQVHIQPPFHLHFKFGLARCRAKKNASRYSPGGRLPYKKLQVPPGLALALQVVGDKPSHVE
jgi:hypothetical protein